jgi:hypothetical protein
MLWHSRARISVVAVLCLAAFAAPAQEPSLTPEEKVQFLLKAKVIGSKRIPVGITSPWRLTLTDGKITHDAHFQSIDESKQSQTFQDGKVELNFRDSYHFNIAGYELAKLVGLESMVPVTVARKWEGKSGALAWWVPNVKMDDRERMRKNAQPPDPAAWNDQKDRIVVFAQLIYDADPNATNRLIDGDWKLWMIDFTRAFRLQPDLLDPRTLKRCDRRLLEKLRQLDAQELAEKTKGHLNKSEVKAVIQRRDKIVAHFEQLIKEKGESEVLY